MVRPGDLFLASNIVVAALLACSIAIEPAFALGAEKNQLYSIISTGNKISIFFRIVLAVDAFAGCLR